MVTTVVICVLLLFFMVKGARAFARAIDAEEDRVALEYFLESPTVPNGTKEDQDWLNSVLMLD